MLTTTPVNSYRTTSLVPTTSKKASNELPEERLTQIVRENPVVDTFLKLAVIPSPTVRQGHPKETEMKHNMDLVRELTAKMFKELGNSITTFVDQYGSLIIQVEGSNEHKNKSPLMFMAHLDIVPGDLDDPLRPIYPILINHPTKDGLKEFIATDGTTTLGGDDKAGVAIIWDVVSRCIANRKPHVPFEIVLAPDEEEDNASLISLDTSKFKAKYVIVVDDDEAFKVTTGCASFVDIKLDVSGLKGAHSAVDNQDDFVSAADILTDLLQAIGNRVVKWNPQIHQPLISKNIYECEIKRTPSNALPVKGHIRISLRSLTQEDQDIELKRIQEEVKRIEERYKPKEPQLEIKIKIEPQLPPWSGNSESTLVKLVKQAALEAGHNTKVQTSHGACQANLLVPKRNAHGEEFETVVVSSKLEDLHSVTEKADWQSMVEVSDWLYRFVQNYTYDHAL